MQLKQPANTIQLPFLNTVFGRAAGIATSLLLLAASLDVARAATTVSGQVDLQDLSPYDAYQLEFQPTVLGTWSDLNAPFMPTSATSTQYIHVEGDTGFLRARYVQ